MRLIAELRKQLERSRCIRVMASFVTITANITLVPTRKSEALLLAAQRGR